MSITPKAIYTIYSRPSDTSLRPILQVLSVSALAGQTGRYKIILSDGESYTTGLLSSTLITSLGGVCPFKQFQLVRLDAYQVNAVQEKFFLLVHGLVEVSPPLPTGQVGNPSAYKPAAQLAGPTASTAAAPSNQASNPYASSNPYGSNGTTSNITNTSNTPFVNPYQSSAPPAANPYQQTSSVTKTPTAFNQPMYPPPSLEQQYNQPSHGQYNPPVQQAFQQPYQPQPSSYHQQPQLPIVTTGPVRYLHPTEQIIPMSHLTIYTQKWTIKARVSNKSDMRTFRNAKGEGQLMTVDLVDSEQSEMRATFFGTAAQKFHPLLVIGKVFTFSKGSVKPANAKFNPKAQYELMFDENSEIKEIPNDNAIPSMKINLVSVASIGNAQVGDTVDVAGVVTAMSEVAQVTIKSTGRDTSKRTVTIVDDSACSVEITIWGDKAVRLGSTDFVKINSSVVVAKGCRVGDFNGKSLSTSGGSLIEVDPELPRVHQLKSWFSAKGRTAVINNLSNQSGAPGNANGTSVGGGSSKRTNINTMREEDVATLIPSAGGFAGMMGNDPSKRSFNSHYLKATVVHIPVRDSAPLYYKSCVQEVDDGKGGRRMCQKKTELQGDCFICAEQHVNRSAIARFILTMRIQDATGECMVRAFHDQGRAILGIDAADIDSSPDPLAVQQTAIENALFKPFMFRIRSKKEIHMDEERTNMIVTEVAPVNPNVDAKHMLTNIKTYISSQ